MPIPCLIATVFPLPLADAVDEWGKVIIGSVGGTGILSAVAWYLLTKWSPKIEEAHEKQLLQQRADLLVLCQKERELAEKVVAIFADAQQITVKDNHEAIQQLHGKADELKEAAHEVIKQLREDTTLRDEYIRTRQRLDEWEKKYGSGGIKRRSDNNPPA
jgi:hypothetical protein